MNSYTKIESIHVHNIRQVEILPSINHASTNQSEKIYLCTEETVYGMNKQLYKKFKLELIQKTI